MNQYLDVYKNITKRYHQTILPHIIVCFIKFPKYEFVCYNMVPFACIQFIIKYFAIYLLYKCVLMKTKPSKIYNHYISIKQYKNLYNYDRLNLQSIEEKHKPVTSKI